MLITLRKVEFKPVSMARTVIDSYRISQKVKALPTPNGAFSSSHRFGWCEGKINEERESKRNCGEKSKRNCGDALAGEYNRVI